MAWLAHDGLKYAVAHYGYFAVALTIGLESMGLPLPGETILILAAMYAAAHADLNIYLVGIAAGFGAIIGDNMGYWLGHRFGYPLLCRYGGRVGMTAPRIRLGQYLFQRYGAAIVFLGRFVALLRILSAFLAGANHMPWRSFLIANATGGIVWAAIFTAGGYYFGKLVFQVHGTIGAIIFVAAAPVFFGTGLLLRRAESQWQVLADRALPPG